MLFVRFLKLPLISVTNLEAGMNGRYLFPSMGVLNCPLTMEKVFKICSQSSGCG